MRRRSAATNARVEADGSVDAQNAPTDPCKTTERFCTSSHTLHRRFPFQKNPRPEPLRISGQLPTDSAEEAQIQSELAGLRQDVSSDVSDAAGPADSPCPLQRDMGRSK